MEAPYKWNQEASCFEKHLKRRYQNPLFPLERRHFTRQEFEEAQARDISDAKALDLDVKHLLETFSRADVKCFIVLNEFLLSAEKLTRHAREIGGSLASRASITLQEFSSSTIKTIRDLIRADSEHLDIFNEAQEQRLADFAQYDSEFKAQLIRNDGPILDIDVLPTILSEPHETIRDLLVSHSHLPAQFTYLAPSIAQGLLQEQQRVMDALEKLRSLDIKAPSLSC